VKPSHWLVTALSAVTLAGCGRVERGEVEGVVRRNGQPLSNVLVSFVPDTDANAKAVRAAGVTDDKGKFRLRSEGRHQGAVVGVYRVIIEDLSIQAAPRSPDGTVLKMPPVRFPAKYGDPLRTPLHQQVRSGAQSVELDLSDGS
jgi:hypothetical protein